MGAMALVWLVLGLVGLHCASLTKSSENDPLLAHVLTFGDLDVRNAAERLMSMPKFRRASSLKPVKALQVAAKEDEAKKVETLTQKDLDETTVKPILGDDGSLGFEIVVPPPSDCPDTISDAVATAATAAGIPPEYVPVGANKPYDPESPLRAVNEGTSWSSSPSPSPSVKPSVVQSAASIPKESYLSVSCDLWKSFVPDSNSVAARPVLANFSFSVSGIDTKDMEANVYFPGIISGGLQSLLVTHGAELSRDDIRIVSYQLQDGQMSFNCQINVEFSDTSAVLTALHPARSADLFQSLQDAFSASYFKVTLSDCKIPHQVVLYALESMSVDVTYAIRIPGTKRFSDACQCALIAAIAKTSRLSLESVEIISLSVDETHYMAKVGVSATCPSGGQCNSLANFLKYSISSDAFNGNLAGASWATLHKCRTKLSDLSFDILPRVVPHVEHVIKEMSLPQSVCSPWTGESRLGPPGVQLMTKENIEKLTFRTSDPGRTVGCLECIAAEASSVATDQSSGVQITCANMTDCWISVDFGAPLIATRFAVSGSPDGSMRPLEKWYLEGSLDGTRWTRVGTAWPQQWGYDLHKTGSPSYPFQDYQIAVVGFPAAYRHYRVSIWSSLENESSSSFRILNFGLWGAEALVLKGCPDDWTLVASEDVGATGTLQSLSDFSNAWASGTRVRIEWGQADNWNYWAEFVPDENPFAIRQPPTAAALFGNTVINVRDFDSNSERLRQWVRLSSSEMSARFCIANSESWDTAWGLLPLDDQKPGDMGCNGPNWSGNGIFYGASKLGCFSGPQGDRESKRCDRALGVRIYVKCVKSPPDHQLLTNESAPFVRISYSGPTVGCASCVMNQHIARGLTVHTNSSSVTGDGPGPVLNCTVYPCWISFKFPKAYHVSKFAVSGFGGSLGTPHEDWFLEGSHDGETWTQLGTAWSWQWESYFISFPFADHQIARSDSSQSFDYFRIRFQEPSDHSTRLIAISNVGLWGWLADYQIPHSRPKTSPLSSCLNPQIGLTGLFGSQSQVAEFNGVSQKERVLLFKKEANDTDVRVEWYDNFALLGQGLFAWRIRVDGYECSMVTIGQNETNLMHFNSNLTDHRFGSSMVAYCGQLDAGYHLIRIVRLDQHLRPSLGIPSKLGEGVVQGVLVGTEVPRLQPGKSFGERGARLVTSHGTNFLGEKDTELAAPRKVGFQKTKEKSLLRIVWSDNFACGGAERSSCRWEVLVDGRSCEPGPLVVELESDEGRWDYRTLTLLGYCAYVGEGYHTLTIRESAVEGEDPIQRAGVSPILGLSTVNFLTLEVYETDATCYLALPQSLESGLGFSSNFRRLNFAHKAATDTRVLVRWFDNFDCHDVDDASHPTRCGFELSIDGQECLNVNIMASSGLVHHQPTTIVGVCSLSPQFALHEVVVKENVLQGLSGGHDVLGELGWKSTTAVIEITLI
eukprot:c19719_g1_i1.p1 GENE.c19719_g1_i1~~c19719_g1_i1.p1  ORF type:complete len:1440 (-),score=162.83 c19719_g1_i1:42-4361(-)